MASIAPSERLRRELQEIIDGAREELEETFEEPMVSKSTLIERISAERDRSNEDEEVIAA
jgi:hypothetical protein